MFLRGAVGLAVLAPRRAACHARARTITTGRFLRSSEVEGADASLGKTAPLTTPAPAFTKATKQQASSDDVYVTMDTFAGSDFSKRKGVEDRNFRGIDVATESLLDGVLGAYGLSPDVAADLHKASSFELASDKEIMKRVIAKTVVKYQRFPGDTGSTEVQVAVLSERIKWLRELMAKFKKNMVTKRALERYFHQRRRLMMYLKRERYDKYNLMLVDFHITEDEIWHWGSLPGRRKTLPRYRRAYSESRWDKDKRETWEQEAKEAKEATELAAKAGMELEKEAKELSQQS